MSAMEVSYEGNMHISLLVTSRFFLDAIGEGFTRFSKALISYFLGPPPFLFPPLFPGPPFLFPSSPNDILLPKISVSFDPS